MTNSDPVQAAWLRYRLPSGDRASWCAASLLLSFSLAGSSLAAAPATLNGKKAEAESVASAPAGQSPFEEELAPVRELASRVKSLLAERNFEALDRLGDRLLKERARWRDGNWMLATYYETLSNPFETSPATSAARHIDQLKAWQKESPQSPQALIALADGLISRAQSARGNGDTRDLTEEQARLFIASMQEANKFLDSAEGLTKKDPELYRARMETVKGSALLGKLKESFDAGVAAEPEYYALYRTMANLLLPKWFGKPGDEVTFAEMTAIRTRETEGDGLYARIALYVYDLDQQDFKKRYNFAWKRVQKGFRDIEKSYPGSLANLNRFTQYACVMEDAFVALSYLDRLGMWNEGRVDKSLWGSVQAYERWRSWAAGRGPNPWGEPLHRAAKSGNLQAIKDQIRQKEDLNSRDFLGQTPLFVACQEGQEEAALLLIEAGADVRAATDTNQTPIYQAAGMGLSRVVEKLLSMRVPANVSETHEGWTPLHLASLRGYASVTKMLLEQSGVDAGAKTSDGKTPLHLAAVRGQIETGRMLVDASPNSVNARTAEGRTPLHYAASQGNPEFVRLLLSHGGDPQIQDTTQRRPLDYAKLRKRPDAVDLLKAAAQNPISAATQASK